MRRANGWSTAAYSCKPSCLPTRSPDRRSNSNLALKSPGGSLTTSNPFDPRAALKERLAASSHSSEVNVPCGVPSIVVLIMGAKGCIAASSPLTVTSAWPSVDADRRMLPTRQPSLTMPTRSCDFAVPCSCELSVISAPSCPRANSKPSGLALRAACGDNVPPRH